jgi:hypothetical protein
MQTPDLINGLFEFAGGGFLLASIVKLAREKVVRGVAWPQVMFFTAWGFWNCFFYPSLDQWFSFVGGVFLVLMNAIWLTQIIHFNQKEKRHVALEPVQ